MLINIKFLYDGKNILLLSTAADGICGLRFLQFRFADAVRYYDCVRADVVGVRHKDRVRSQSYP
mgnify:CR=1 FL=1